LILIKTAFRPNKPGPKSKSEVLRMHCSLQPYVWLLLTVQIS